MTNTLADYDPLVAAAAYLVSVLGALVGLFTGRYVRDAAGNIRMPWLILCALAISACMMWASHFVAMLAYDPGVPYTFGLRLTLLSLAMSAIFSMFAVLIVTRHPESVAVLVVGGAVMAMGMVALHYGGTAALRVPYATVHDPAMTSVSIVIAFVVSTGALYVLEHVAHAGRYLAVLLMGAAVCAMHFTGMAGLEVGVEQSTAYFSGAITARLMGLLVAAIALLTAGLGVVLGAVGYLEATGRRA